MLATLVSLTACWGSGGHQRTADKDGASPTGPSSTTSTTVSYAVPATIDAAYVEKVMKALDHLYGDAVRQLVTDHAMSDRFIKQLLALYSKTPFEGYQVVWRKSLNDGLKSIAPQPGDPLTHIQAVLQASPTCVVVQVDRDLSPTLARRQDESPQRFVALIPKDPARDPLIANPTPWTMSFDGYTQTGKVPEGPCEP
ncbi:MAG: hypothetical protein QOE80_1351 [Actinomycetota bacterium]|nr:hypothetical protein [Actinomycetota bacterium]